MEKSHDLRRRSSAMGLGMEREGPQVRWGNKEGPFRPVGTPNAFDIPYEIRPDEYTLKGRIFGDPYEKRFYGLDEAEKEVERLEKKTTHMAGSYGYGSTWFPEARQKAKRREKSTILDRAKRMIVS